MECREFPSRSVVDIVCCETVVCRAFSPLRAFVLECRFAGIGSLGQGEHWRMSDAAGIDLESQIVGFHVSD